MGRQKKRNKNLKNRNTPSNDSRVSAPLRVVLSSLCIIALLALLETTVVTMEGLVSWRLTMGKPVKVAETRFT